MRGARTSRSGSCRGELGVDRGAWEAARAALRRCRRAVDGDGVRGGPRGPERALRVAGGGRVGTRGEDAFSGLGRRRGRVAARGAVGKGDAMVR